MPQDMKTWRKNARARLIVELGAKCVGCGSTGELWFDHIVPLSDEDAEKRVRMGGNKRMVMYRKEAKLGRLQLLCLMCSKRKSIQPKQGTLPNAPF